MKETKGQCLCGSVTFTGVGPLGAVEVCHCRTCRQHTAGPLMSTSFADGIRVDREGDLRWYASSPIAERGFCGHCGTTLFWRLTTSSAMSVSPHVLDATPESIREHVFSDEKPDWYAFADDAPRVTSAQMLARLEAWKKRQQAAKPE